MLTVTSSFGFPIDLKSAAVELKNCVITGGSKKCKSIIKKKTEGQAC